MSGSRKSWAQIQTFKTMYFSQYTITMNPSIVRFGVYFYCIVKEPGFNMLPAQEAKLIMLVHVQATISFVASLWLETTSSSPVS